MKKNTLKNKNTVKFSPLKNQRGIIIADFLFAFVMVIGIAIFIFAMTFSLATIEIAQYIAWSTARNYAAANVTKEVAEQNARDKFKNLIAHFPLLTGVGSDSPWFRMSEDNLVVGDNLADGIDTELSFSGDDRNNDFRQPWTGARMKIMLSLFAGLKVPFLGKVAEDPTLFEFPVRAFIIRHPSQVDCQNFFYGKRFTEGIKRLEESRSGGPLAPDSAFVAPPIFGGYGEDNGC